ncbi:DUF4190 domain-containing protein [Aeromicrobium sp.]|uniref:DUF4190 domain-containing protein n=1 Tax=Aeromicrobium sp. TaxID=1871063 RepID=UPI0030C17FD8
MTTNEPPPYPGEPTPPTNDLPSYGSTPPPPGGFQAPAPGGYGAPPQQNKKALWSMILGILGLLCCGFFTGIPALILGNQAKKEIAASGGSQTGGGMATAGVILGIVAIVFGVISLILFATGALDFSTT